jgi:hypothetical protein
MVKFWLLVLFIPCFALAQSPWAVYGGGGFSLTYMKPDLASINSKVAEIGFPELRDKSVIGSGGMGYVLVISGRTRFILGGGGAGGSIRVKDGNLETELRHNYAYFQVGFPHMFSSKLIGGITASLGAGTFILDLKEYEEEPDWSTPPMENLTTTFRLRKKFFMATPSVFLEFHLLPFLAIRAEGGYFLPFAEEFKQEGTAVTGAPDFTGRNLFGALTLIVGGGGTSF